MKWREKDECTNYRKWIWFGTWFTNILFWCIKFLKKIQLTLTYHGNKKDFVSNHLRNGELNDYILKYIEKAFDTRQTERSENSRFIETDFTNTNFLIQEIYDNRKDNVWYNYLWNIYSQGKMKGINWIDFETEISQIVELIDREEQNLYLPFKRPVTSEDEKANIFLLFLNSINFWWRIENWYAPCQVDRTNI